MHGTPLKWSGPSNSLAGRTGRAYQRRLTAGVLNGTYPLLGAMLSTFTK